MNEHPVVFMLYIDTPLSDASRQPPSTTSLKGIFTAGMHDTVACEYFS